MGIFNGCLLVSDIDGTLIHEGVIPARNIEKIKDFIKQGGRFTVASGRSFDACREYYEKSGCNCPAISFNGAVVYDYDNQKIIHKTQLPKSDTGYIEQILEKFPSIGIEVHSVDKIFVLNRTEIIDWHLKYEGLTGKDANFTDIINYEWTKVLFACYDRQKLLDFYDYAKDLPFKGSYLLETAPIFFELTSKAANKGNAMLKLAEHLKIKPDKIFAIGDYYNDVEMLKAAGVSALAKDAPDDIKIFADYIACSCTQGAVADFIEYLEHNIGSDGN